MADSRCILLSYSEGGPSLLGSRIHLTRKAGAPYSGGGFWCVLAEAHHVYTKVYTMVDCSVLDGLGLCWAQNSPGAARCSARKTRPQYGGLPSRRRCSASRGGARTCGTAIDPPWGGAPEKQALKAQKLAFLLISSEIRAHHGKSCLNGELLLGLHLDHDRADCHRGA